MWSTGSICPSFLSHVIPPLRAQGCGTAVIFSAAGSDFSGWMHSVSLVLLLLAAPWAAWALHSSGALTLSTSPCSPQCSPLQTPPVAHCCIVFHVGHILFLLQLPPVFLTETAHRVRDPHSLDLSYFHQGFARTCALRLMCTHSEPLRSAAQLGLLAHMSCQMPVNPRKWAKTLTDLERKTWHVQICWTYGSPTWGWIDRSAISKALSA